VTALADCRDAFGEALVQLAEADPRIVALIPAYNEERFIGSVVLQAHRRSSISPHMRIIISKTKPYKYKPQPSLHQAPDK